ncbi:MAG: nonstructural protein [Microvirus sp.]|nr:MAG: nonstructural protein [Microvirus sp.]
MKLYVCAIRDRALDAFGTPIFVAAIGLAVRSFTDEINRKADGNPYSAHPEDYDLYVLGTFDSDDGSFECGKPRQVSVGKDVVNVSQ